MSSAFGYLSDKREKRSDPEKHFAWEEKKPTLISFSKSLALAQFANSSKLLSNYNFI